MIFVDMRRYGGATQFTSGVDPGEAVLLSAGVGDDAQVQAHILEVEHSTGRVPLAVLG